MSKSILDAPQFHDAEAARKHLEAQVWPDGPVCPHCGVISDHYKLEGKTTRPGLYKCKDCREPFTVTVGTVFQKSKIPLNKWLLAVYLLCASKKGMSSHQLHRTLGVTYKTAWFMTHRIREAMDGRYTSSPLGSGGGIVEVDETFWGNKKDTKTVPPGKKRAGYAHKMAILALVERGGNARSYHVKDLTTSSVKTRMAAEIAKDAHLMTDDASRYNTIGKRYASHESVNHSKGEYARGIATTNSVEGYFSILKRGLIGTYHHVSEEHLQRYCHEFDFRYSHRNITDSERADEALKGIAGKRLTYRRSGEAPEGL